MNIETSRRRFLMGCSTAIAAMAGSRLSAIALGDPATAAGNREVLVMVFLRGGMDGLSLLPPIGGEDREHYETARPILRIPVAGTGAALPLSGMFGLHPSAQALLPLFQSGKLAVIQAVGSAGSRSHFDAQKYIELGTPGSQSITTGWLTRHLLSSPGLGTTILAPALATGVTPPTSLQGSTEAIHLDHANGFNLAEVGHWSWVISDHRIALRRMYHAGTTFAHAAGREALDAIGIIENYVAPNYTPSAGVKYPDTDLGRHLRLVAQMIKLDVGLRVATVDYGGWDTHENQGDDQSRGWFSDLLRQLAEGLSALYADLDGSTASAPINRVTVLVQSEFGRRIRENARKGTDHGTANPVLVLGGNVRGGLYGTWPGLHPDQRFDGADLAPTTDFRRVLAEIVIRRLGNPRLGVVLPKYEGYSPIGFVVGEDLAPDYSISALTAPGDLKASRASEVVRLTWTAVSSATGYRIERRSTVAGAWESLVTLSGSSVAYDDAAAPSGDGVVYRIQSLGVYGESAFGQPAAVSASSMTRLEGWRLKHYGSTANSGDGADDRIPSSDGLTNYAKYALGLDPRVPAAPTVGLTPGLPVRLLEAGRFSLVYVRPADRSDVRYEVKGSVDLRNWSPVAEVLEASGDGMERYRASVSVAGKPEQFLKLEVRPAGAAVGSANLI